MLFQQLVNKMCSQQACSKLVNKLWQCCSNNLATRWLLKRIWLAVIIFGACFPPTWPPCLCLINLKGLIATVSVKIPEVDHSCCPVRLPETNQYEVHLPQEMKTGLYTYDSKVYTSCLIPDTPTSHDDDWMYLCPHPDHWYEHCDLHEICSNQTFYSIFILLKYYWLYELEYHSG
jgi:hypothetical protein